jgi:translation initiation factor IF-2
MLRMMNREDTQEEVAVVIKADVQGSLTSVVDSLKVLSTDEVAVKIVAAGVGAINESDIRIARTTGAVIYGFSTDVSKSAAQMAKRAKIGVRLYKVIYELIDDVKAEMSAKLPAEIVETELAALKVKGVFRTTRDEIIAGGDVTKGKFSAGVRARILRGKDELGEVMVERIQKEKNEIKEAVDGDEIGISLKTDGRKIVLEIGDRLEMFTREEKKRTI